MEECECFLQERRRMHSSLAMRKEDCNVQTRTRDCVALDIVRLLIAPLFARTLIRMRTYPVHNRRTPTPPPSTLQARRWLVKASICNSISYTASTVYASDRCGYEYSGF
ncbi:hypothetical protein CBL_03377 [Carabus blaptoides fortunei]